MDPSFVGFGSFGIKFSCVLSNKKDYFPTLVPILGLDTRSVRRANNFFKRLPECQVDYIIVGSVMVPMYIKKNVHLFNIGLPCMHVY